MREQIEKRAGTTVSKFSAEFDHIRFALSLFRKTLFLCLTSLAMNDAWSNRRFPNS
jgi:hypothetical protein